MGKYRTRELTQRVRYALLAGVAGAFLIPQVAAAAPTGEHDMTSGVHVGRTTTAAGTDTNITGTRSAASPTTPSNNVIKWADYSVKQGETVTYDANNYLNIVTGGNTSAINGSITGGGDIYLVNPNGVIFGKTASVNVGNLYVSTQEKSTLNQEAFKGSGASPLSTTVTDVGKADVVNMGSITANKVEVYGRSIRILDAANVHAATSPVILHIDEATNGGYAHIGYQSGHVPSTSDYEIHKKFTPQPPSPSAPPPPPEIVVAAATAADNYYQLVSTPTQFQNINNNPSGNYMLANDIDFTDSTTHAAGEITPIGGNTIGPTTYAAYSGKFDGNFFRIQNYKVTNPALERAGLFGELNHAQIYNLGVTGATVTGDTSRGTSRAGGVAGYSYGGTSFLNVYIKNSTINGFDGYHGGLIGYTTNTTLDSVYSKATIGEGGGIIGYSSSGTTVTNAYSDVKQLPNTSGAYFIYYVLPSSGTTVTNAYSTGLFSYSNSTPNVTNTFIADKDTGKIRGKDAPVTDAIDGYASKNYAAWGNAINNTGAPGAKWRIYEGRTLPLLTAFMDGTATATYNYRYFKPDGTPKDDTGNKVKSNDGKDITAAYNSYYMKVVDGSTANPTAAGTKANVSFGAGADTSHVIDYVNSSTKDYDRTNGIRNAGTKAMFWSDQDGPNLSGVNVTITPREVRLDNGTINPNRMYNGKSDVTDAFIAALTSGSISTSGFTAEDIAAGSVQLDFNKTGKIFKARMVDGSGNATRNVGTHDVKFSGEIGFSGADAGNYTFDGSSLSNLTGKATITKAPLYLTIQKKTADDKIYDGTSVVKDSAMFQTSGSENIKLDKTKTGLTLAQIDAGTPTMPDGAIMTGDDDTTRDDVALTNVGGPKYTDEAGVEQLHAGPHKLQYTNVGLTGNDAGNYELYYTPASGTKTAVTGGNVYLDGKIIPRQILRDNFNVYDKTTHAKVDAKKVYDGNDEYTPTSDVYLSSNAATGDTTGLVERDRNHITFALTGSKGHFAQSDGTTYSKNVRDVEKLAYEVTGHTDDATNYRLSDYYIMDGTTKKDLGSTFHATGAGKITPKALTATVVNQHITKVYDAMDDQTDGKRHIIKGDDLVTLSGWVAGDTARTNTSTAKYATKNVVLDGSGNPTTQSVTYTASFDEGTGVEADNYTLGTEGVTPIATTKTLTGGYTGTITPRGVTVKFADVTKVYDGTVTNTQITASDLDDGLNKDVLNADGLGVTNLNTTGVISRYGDNKMAATFIENRNAGSRSVEYAGLTNALGTNYKLDAKQYGDGTITRRRIDPSGFKVRKSDGTLADATKVYDGTDTYNLPSGAYLTGSTASGDTGIVSHDFGKVVFELKSNSPGHFTKDAAGANRTSHKSEAKYIAYDVKAKTLDPTNNPLSNYTFGVAGSPRNLETVTDANPAQVTAGGSITSASLRAATQEISKVYDGLTAHTDGNRNPVKGDTVVSFTGWAVHDGTTEKRTNSSTAEYATKDVAYDGSGNVIKKSVTYTGQLTGQYADDYQIVDAGNHVISTANGSGATKTVTMNAPITVADAGKITPRKLNIKMGDVSKTYDGTAGNTSATVTGFTDDPASSVLAAVLGVDNVTATRLANRYQGMVSPANTTTTSTYGRVNTDATFGENVNASNGTPHDVQYTNMRNAFKDEFGATTAGNYIVDDIVYGKGTINRREITSNNFQVKDANGNVANATKVYDGTTKYTLENGWHLTPAAGPGTGVIPADYGKVVFRLNGDAQFADSSDNPTANVASATKVLYNVKAEGDAEKIKNYTLNGVNLESGAGKVSGGGSITRRVLELDLVQNSGIDKVYDGTTTLKNTATKNWNALRDSDSTGNVRYATGATAKDKLVTTDGTSFNITSNYMESGSADKNVKRSGGNIVDKDILYKVAINGNATNYSFKKGGTVTNAESGLELSATGKITPKDLSGAFAKITKEYDGTKNVPVADVKFKTGADGVIAGDNITFTHTEAFQSPNVRGDGTPKTIDGTEQKNWINYSGLSLDGTSADNYTINATAVGLGEITPLQLTPSNVTLTTTPATKEYDGGVKVKKGGSDAISAIKNYITGATVTVGGRTVDVLPAFELKSAEYDSKDVKSGATTDRVTYHMEYTGTSGNFTLAPGAETFDGKGDGEITKKDVTATIKGSLTKVYDATADTIGAAKNATTGAAVVTADDLVTFVGLVTGDGATNATTATFDNKNVGTNKTVTYDIKLDTASAGNYNIKYNGSAITAHIPQAGNTITKRKVNVTFGEQHKSYDGLSKNTSIDASVSAADAAVLNHDVTGLAVDDKLTNLTATGTPPNIISNYGKRTGTGFTPDANAGTNKDVQYAGLSAAMNTSLGGNAGNYEFDMDGYGKGYIEKANINASDVTFAASNAAKVYDGTKTVKYNGSSASNDVKNYITTASVVLNGNTVDLRNDLVMDTTGTQYSSANATNGTPATVTYKFHLNNSNINISGDNNFTKTANGTIDRRVLKLGLAQDSAIDKIYDANAKLIDTNTRHYDKFIDDDASGNVIYAAGTTNDNKLVRTANGAAVNDGAKMTITANYVDDLTNRAADKNVARDTSSGNVTAKGIAYNVRIDAANGGKNYTLDHNGTTANAEDGLKMNASGTITPRAMTLGFADVDKPYDTTATNNTKTINSVMAGNSDGRGAATLAADNITSATFGSATGSVNSLYGAVDTDATFHSDPNVVTDADGNVVERGKDVQYTNVRSVLTGALANNYTVADTAYGKGTIRKRSVTANDFRFNISNATKMYDGTKDVEYVENGQTYKDLAHVKKRFQNSKLDLGGNLVDINLEDIDLTGAAYNDERVAHANGVNYDVTINTKNFEFTGSRNRTINHTGDTITKRDLATKLPPHLIKEYDGEDTFTETNEIFANAMARANLTGVVDRDKNNIQLKVKGTYSSPDASVETRADAEARKPATAGRNVAYELTLSGDADTLSNYKIGTVETLDSNGEMKGNGSGKADIYKKTLTVSADPIDKVYDGTRTVVRPNGSTTAPHPAANKLKLNGFAKMADHFDFDQTAADKIDGLYSDPNVSRAADGTILDKDIAYSGVKAAFKNYADNHAGSTARNYRVDSDTVSGKGTIKARPIDANDIVNVLQFNEASKVYDGTNAIKYNGSSASADLINYLASAKININGKEVDLKTDLRIDDKKENTHYADKDAHGEATQNNLTYHLNYVGNNFAVRGSIDKTNAKGKILRKEITATVNGPLTKEYDATRAVYDAADSSIKTFHKRDLSRQNQVDRPDALVTIHGLVAGDGATNATTAHYGGSVPSDDDKNVGTDKTVTYDVKIDPANADNYHISSATITTRGNEITPRRLTMKFRNVDKIYDGTAENDDVRAYTDAADDRKVLERDHITFNADDNVDGLTDVDSRYGDVTNGAFTDNPNAGAHKVRYQNISRAMNALLGNAGANYKIADEVLGDGTIKKATVGRNSFDFVFDRADKEYDGTAVVYGKNHSTDLFTNLNSDETQPTHSKVTWQDKNGHTLTRTLRNNDVKAITGEYRDGKNALVHVSTDPNNPNPVDYHLVMNADNFAFNDTGMYDVSGAGQITKRKLIADPSNYLTKEYDGTAEIIGKARNAQGTLITAGGDNLVKFHHYSGTPTHPDDGEDTVFYKDAAAGTVSNNTTADYVDKNVEWQGGVWNQGRGVVGDKNVKYTVDLTGTDAANYEVVHADGTAVTPTNPYVGKGKIMPKEIVLKADPQERWINEGLPTSYTGTPMGKNLSYNEVPEIVPSDTPLPGTIDYRSPNARLRVGYYAVEGTYHALNGADGDTVSWNYRFIQDPANKTALYIGPYIPDYEYYKAMTQVSKMTPDEYAYENASLDRTNQYSRKPTAQVDPVPPTINVVKDGVDIRQNDINVLDDTVYTIVDEVFG